MAAVFTEAFTITISGNDVQIPFQWNINEVQDIGTPFFTIDLVIPARGTLATHETSGSEASHRTPTHSHNDSQPLSTQRAISFFEETFALAYKETQTVGLKLIITSIGGFVLRSDFLEQRFVDYKHVKRIAEFLEPCQHLEAPVLPHIERQGLLSFLPSMVGAMSVVEQDSNAVLGRLGDLEHDTRDRLSFVWLSQEPMPKVRLAVVEGGFNPMFRAASFRAAKALGISLVILDKPGHWLQDSAFADFRAEFIPVDLAVDELLPQRIVDAVRQSREPVDGLVTFADSYLVPTAMAAELLGLPSSASASSFKASTNKYHTRQVASDLNPDSKFPAMSVSNTTDLRTSLDALNSPITFPLIIKPLQGSGSHGVVKVNSLDELYAAVEKACNGKKITLITEHYASGPEVDANFVLLDGEILFFEMCDDFPSSADVEIPEPAASFIESQNVFPSSLPTSEQTSVRDFLFQVLRSLGFVSGVFHVEARIEHSAKAYQTDSNGLFDLTPLSPVPASKPSVFLIEVNARCPGFQVNHATRHTYGVDYYALQLLFALGDKQRIRSLATPFLGGAQYHCAVTFVPAVAGGTFDSDDPIEDLQKRRPDLMSHVVECHALFRRGDNVPAPESGTLRWIASFIIGCKESRKELLQLASSIRDEFRFQLV